MNLSLQSDIKDVYKDLKATKIQSPRMNKKMLTSAAGGGRTRARQATYKNGLKKGTGDLQKKTASKTWQKGDMTEGYIVNRAVQASNLVFGNTITPKKANYLVFQIDGHFIKTKVVNIPGGDRLGFFTTLDRYFASNEPAQRMTKVLDRELTKIWGKAK